MKKHAFVIFLVSLYLGTQVCIEFGKVFLDVGAAKLMGYTWADWLVLSVPTAGTVGVTALAFFSRTFANHMAKLEHNGDTEIITKP